MKNSTRLKRQARSILVQLNSADRSLKKARRWGLWDILGGKSLVSFFKHRNIKKAERKLYRIERQIGHFQRDLNSYYISMGTNIGGGSFNKFMDIFIDHQLADLYTQFKISDARREIKYLKRNMKQIIREL